MVLRPTPSTWAQSLDMPSRLFSDRGNSDYELYEEDDAFVLTIDMPGFETDEIELAWDDGVLNVAAEHVDDERGRKKTSHRRFRFPKDIDDDAIAAEYTNGVLEVELPVADTRARGKEIPLEG
ncbi:Hsp20/alpha crystallin family protein [Natronolimnohabitans sp. A-GB9]|uniref:Hsp20/alpha crystallin family protein n=1 Tax=Natronolimnohabitans sp. A-GB9 TaxID=3069757 RepID=UPI0027AF6354|nr:Hsp20/alpha crystallin family protein [Natronolimnohabitans sp. A-GB9]MDQ2052783.1 Hsp20/alpha crystallin family protein [Natronolimnohabitans sp. A-GB9]